LEVYDPTTGKTTRYETVFPGNVDFSKLYSEKHWISGDESDGEIAEISVTKESALDPGNPDNSLGSTPSIDDDNAYVDTVRQVPIFSI